jgi:hypothetical protein
MLQPFLQVGTTNVFNQKAEPGVPIPNLADLLYQTFAGAEITPTEPAPNLKNPRSTQFGLAVERKVSNRWTVSAAYAGNLGSRLLRIDTPAARQVFEPFVPAVEALPSPYFQYFPGWDPGTCCYHRLDSNTIRAVNPTLYASGASSHYNSLQLEAHAQYSNFHAASAFTWSHSIDDASDFFDSAGSFALPQDSAHPRGERASSNFDVRLRSVTHFVLQSPAKDVWKNHLIQNLFGQWSLSGILTFQTGQPFTVNTAYDVNQDGNLTDRLNTASFLLGPGVGRNVPGLDGRTRLVLPPGAHTFQYLCAPAGGGAACDGAIGRNTFRAAGIADFDSALSRTLTPKGLPEGHRILLRLEGFNIFNRSNFAIPVRILEEASFGRSVSTSTPNRILQAVIKYSF